MLTKNQENYVQAHTKQQSVLAHRGTVNRQIQLLTPENKFTPEKGLTGEHTYIIRFRDDAIANYNGHINGFAATNIRAAGKKASKLYDAKQQQNSAAITSYKNYLLKKQDNFVQKASTVGVNVEPRMQFTNALNGMSVKLTQDQALKLAELSDVIHIHRARNMELLSDVGPEHIGAGKVWRGESTQGMKYQGEGIVVGIIDSGVNTDHMSFADISGDGYDHVNPWGKDVYVGDCLVAGQEGMCNDKLIGVRSYSVITDTYDHDVYQDPNKSPWDPNVLIAPKNGEDYHGHGSHVASTAAGNVIVNAPLVQPALGDHDGIDTGFDFERVSGVAPRSNIVSYQACYPSDTEAGRGCPEEALVASIEDAISDGVDVINMSIGGIEKFPWEDPTALAFLAAREAGISVAVAAGNSGGFYIGHNAPWHAVIGASNHGRTIAVEGKSLGEMTGGDSTPPSGFDAAGISEAYTGNIVLAADFGDELCAEPFPAGTFNGEIVVCKRGGLARVTKAENALAGGAGGFILYNADDYGDESNTVNDVYALPGAHINKYDGDQLVAWLSSGSGHRATITASEISTPINEEMVDTIADFSSRGPSREAPHNIVPNFSAPGENVWAAFADQHPFNGAPSADWGMLGGTSMASPHVAGSMALVKQARPDWTEAEVQSALQMTATPAKPKTDAWGNTQVLTNLDGGTGIVNVSNAINAGFILDETVENFVLANPRNGGDPRNMNMPQLVDMDCKGGCTWVRTIEATQDGNWKIETETDEFSVRIEAIPSEFSIKAGEKKTILFKGSVLDSQVQYSNSELTVLGKVKFSAQEANIPDAVWPAAFRFNGGNLPEKVNFMAHRDAGKEVISNLYTESIVDFTSRTYQPVKADIHDFTLIQDDDTYSPINDGSVEDDSDYVAWIDVPAGSKRMMAELLGQTASTAINEWERGVATMLVGYDVNGDGVVQPQDEAICFSNAAYENNWCNINNPDPGKYWVLVHNHPEHDWDSERPHDTYQMATAVVTGDMADSMSVTGPEQTNGLTPYSIEIHHDMAMAKGDIYYGGFDIGTDAGNPGNIGFVPLRMERGNNEISMMSSQTQARAGDIVEVTVDVLANNTGADREFTFASSLPDGATLVPGSVRMSGTMAHEVSEADNGFTVTGNQLDTRDWQPDYKVTTNITDAQCKTPYFGRPTDGGYVDLIEYNIGPVHGGVYNQNLQVPFSALWADDPTWALYNNTDYASSKFVEISPMGYVKLDDMPLFWPIHLAFPFNSFPDQLIGVNWMGDFFNGEVYGTPLNDAPETEDGFSGISIATTTNKDLIIEWDNTRSERVVGFDWETQTPIVEPTQGDNYDMQLIANLNTRHDRGQFELIMAYDNIDFGSAPGLGSIGLQGYTGPRGYFGPIYDYKGVSFALNDLKDKLHNDLVVCYDYQGPESSQMQVSYQMRVDENAVGTGLELNVDTMMSGWDDNSVSMTLSVPSNIKVGHIDNQTIDEDSVLEGIMVAYSDADNGANTISVSGEGISAVVHGHEAGSTIDIVPDANFSGETEVTVTVTDNLYPADSHSVSFMLTVNGHQDAPTAVVTASAESITEGESITLDASNSMDPDGDVISYKWTGPGTIADDGAVSTSVSGLTVGSHTFTLTVSDGVDSASSDVSVTVNAKAVEPVVQPPQKKSSSGALTWLGLGIASLLFTRRRKR